MPEPKRLTGAVLVLACLAAPVAAWPASRDRDRDGLPDRWERRFTTSTKKATAERDPDRDRLTNRREYRLRTNPRRSDTDRDGYGDAVEVRGGTDPRDPASHPGTGGGRAVTGRHGDGGPGRWIAGQTICLASGNYGIWHGVDKAVTVRPQAGATPSMGIHFTTDAAGFRSGSTSRASLTPTSCSTTTSTMTSMATSGPARSISATPPTRLRESRSRTRWSRT